MRTADVRLARLGLRLLRPGSARLPAFHVFCCPAECYGGACFFLHTRRLVEQGSQSPLCSRYGEVLPQWCALVVFRLRRVAFRSLSFSHTQLGCCFGVVYGFDSLRVRGAPTCPPLAMALYLGVGGGLRLLNRSDKLLGPLSAALYVPCLLLFHLQTGQTPGLGVMRSWPLAWLCVRGGGCSEVLLELFLVEPIIKSRSSGRPKLSGSISRFNCGSSFCGKRWFGSVEASG
ncbi:hypothetical protein F2Q69_00029342 [Brassica cretica]|uniref:Uncharacterized protein n=1 Tax=Brassica cretica TaxID=69181 RepID=A0A8S9S9X7_BRACR|nr:hypothetical protein F2Q69_00029342 [Brassica cretica]